jgi:hypothetical protein
MRSSRPRARTRLAMAAMVALAACCAPAGASWQGAPARQVVVFGVLATPGGSAMDPKLVPVVQAQLRRTLPGHSFKLIKVQNERVLTGQSVVCNMGGGFVASTTLMNPLDTNGKVQIRYELSQFEVPQFQTIVATPPDQFIFFDKMLPNNERLLVGVGAR